MESIIDHGELAPSRDLVLPRADSETYSEGKTGQRPLQHPRGASKLPTPYPSVCGTMAKGRRGRRKRAGGRGGAGRAAVSQSQQSLFVSQSDKVVKHNDKQAKVQSAFKSLERHPGVTLTLIVIEKPVPSPETFFADPFAACEYTAELLLAWVNECLLGLVSACLG